MDDPRPELQAALKDAMKNKDKQRRDVIRLLQSAIKQEEVDSSGELSAEDVVDILQKEAKKRRESIEEYEKAGRDGLAQDERDELVVIKDFLPKQLSKEEIEVIVKEAIENTGATSKKEMGQVMGQVMPKVKGRADGKLVNQVVREQLS